MRENSSPLVAVCVSKTLLAQAPLLLNRVVWDFEKIMRKCVICHSGLSMARMVDSVV